MSSISGRCYCIWSSRWAADLHVLVPSFFKPSAQFISFSPRWHPQWLHIDPCYLGINLLTQKVVLYVLKVLFNFHHPLIHMTRWGVMYILQEWLPMQRERPSNMSHPHEESISCWTSCHQWDFDGMLSGSGLFLSLLVWMSHVAAVTLSELNFIHQSECLLCDLSSLN